MNRKSFNIREIAKESDVVNRLFEDLFRYKTEEINHLTSASARDTKTYREAETGLQVYSNVSSTSTLKTIAFAKSYDDIFNISIENVGTAFSTIITSFTASEMTVKINANTTATKVKFFWRVTGTLG